MKIKPQAERRFEKVQVALQERYDSRTLM